VLAGGGRFDRLLTLLGAEAAFRPVGFRSGSTGSSGRKTFMTITIGLPSKGRMKEDSSAVLERAGLKIVAVGNDRSYRGRVEGFDDIEIAFLSASEIAREIGAGNRRFRVTGEDLIRKGWRKHKRVEISARLGFGHADVRRRRAGNLARRRHHGRSRGCPPPTSAAVTAGVWRSPRNTGVSPSSSFPEATVSNSTASSESLGATGRRPAAGQADIIVDITSTGSTLRANHLKILSDGVILRSEACLVRARKPEHEGNARVAEIVAAVQAALR